MLRAPLSLRRLSGRAWGQPSQRHFASATEPTGAEWLLSQNWLKLDGEPSTLTVESGVLQICSESNAVSAGASSVLALHCSSNTHQQWFVYIMYRYVCTYVHIIPKTVHHQYICTSLCVCVWVSMFGCCVCV